MPITSTIFVTFEREGIHAYPDAPKEVEFLKFPHRHIFKFKVVIEVFHNERDLEFIMFKRELESLYNVEAEINIIDRPLKLNNMSCEGIAQELIEYITTTYPKRMVHVSVSEDGENGAILMYYPPVEKND